MRSARLLSAKRSIRPAELPIGPEAARGHDAA